MNRKFQLLITATWLALPLLALRYWQAWDHLPARMASHFDAAGHTNGWMSREASLIFGLGFMAFMLTVFSVVLLAAHRKSSVGTFSWWLLAFFYLQIGLIYYGSFDSDLARCLSGIASGPAGPFRCIGRRRSACRKNFKPDCAPPFACAGLGLQQSCDVCRSHPTWLGRSDRARCLRHGMERLPLFVYELRGRDTDSWLSAVHDSSRRDQDICRVQLEHRRRLRHSWHRQSPRLCVGQPWRSHPDYGRRNFSRPQRSATHHSRSRRDQENASRKRVKAA
jgi:hypothetical protein